MKKTILWFSVIVAIITLVAAFTITGCKKTTVTDTVAATAVSITVSETTAPATTAVETTAPATTAGIEDYKATIKDSVKIIISTYSSEMTKFDIDDNFSLMTISYDTKQSSEDKIKKEMYNIISDLSSIGIETNLTATNDSGHVYHSYNTVETLYKIKDLEMNYSKWLKVAFK